MSNYMNLGDGRLQMPFGILSGVSTINTSKQGLLESVVLTEKNIIVTHVGELYPAYSQTPRRKHKPSIEFFPNGLTKAVALEEQQEVQTPIGELPAELVTFYDSGELHRVFPTDGQISGFWTEDEERDWNFPLSFDLGFTAFTARINSICFYQSGAIQSITLYPGEIITLQIKIGTFSVKDGFSLYETEALRSFEPAKPTTIPTPIGSIIAHNPLSQGVCADFGSVILSESGSVLQIKTDANRILVQPKDAPLQWHTPVSIPHPCSDDAPYYQPLTLSFTPETITITDTATHTYSLTDCHFSVTPFSDGSVGCSPADCANCSLCSH